MDPKKKRTILYDDENDVFIIREDDIDADITTIRYILPSGEEFVDAYETSSGRGVGETMESSDIGKMLKGVKSELDDPSLRENFARRHPETRTKYPDLHTPTEVTSPKPPPSEELKTAIPTGKNPYEAAEEFKTALARREVQAMERLGTSYTKIWDSLRGDINTLSRQIDADWKNYQNSDDFKQLKSKLDSGEISKNEYNKQIKSIFQGRLTRLAQLQEIEQKVRAQVADFVGDDLLPELRNISTDALKSGLADAEALMKLTLPGDLADLLEGSFSTPNLAALETAMGFVSEDSAVYSAIRAKYSDEAARVVAEAIPRGIAAGDDPLKTARKIRDNIQAGLGKSLTWAAQTVRTTQMNSYRYANHEKFRENSDIVKGWVWSSTLDDSTCMACVRMHGTRHDITETLNEHHRGKCTPIPETVTWADLGIEGFEDLDPKKPKSGVDWFDEQSEATQKKMMGYKTWDAWQEAKKQGQGREFFNRLATEIDDPVWGKMTRRTSSDSLIAGAGGREIKNPVDAPYPTASATKRRKQLERVMDDRLRALGGKNPQMDPEFMEAMREYESLEFLGESSVRRAVPRRVEDITDEKVDIVNGLVKDLPEEHRGKVSRILLTEFKTEQLRHLSAVHTSLKGSSWEGLMKERPYRYEGVLGDKTYGVYDPDAQEVLVHPWTLEHDETTLVHEVAHHATRNLPDYGKHDVDAMHKKLSADESADLGSIGLRSNSTKDVYEFLADAHVVNTRGTDEQRRKLATYLGLNDLDELFEEE